MIFVIKNNTLWNHAHRRATFQCTYNAGFLKFLIFSLPRLHDTCNLNRKIAIPINQRKINGILTRSSFKLSYRLRNITVYQNLISFQNCVEYVFHNQELP